MIPCELQLTLLFRCSTLAPSSTLVPLVLRNFPSWRCTGPPFPPPISATACPSSRLSYPHGQSPSSLLHWSHVYQSPEPGTPCSGMIALGTSLHDHQSHTDIHQRNLYQLLSVLLWLSNPKHHYRFCHLLLAPQGCLGPTPPNSAVHPDGWCLGVGFDVSCPYSGVQGITQRPRLLTTSLSSTCAFDIVRLVVLVNLNNGGNFTRNQVNLSVWTDIEPSIAILVACLPILRPLLRPRTFLKLRNESAADNDNTEYYLRDDMSSPTKADSDTKSGLEGYSEESPSRNL